MSQWAPQDAKANLSKLVKKAQHRPQFISVRGEPAVVVISEEAYKKLITPKISLVEFFQNSPLVGLELDFARDKNPWEG